MDAPIDCMCIYYLRPFKVQSSLAVCCCTRDCSGTRGLLPTGVHLVIPNLPYTYYTSLATIEPSETSPPPPYAYPESSGPRLPLQLGSGIVLQRWHSPAGGGQEIQILDSSSTGVQKATTNASGSSSLPPFIAVRIHARFNDSSRTHRWAKSNFNLNFPVFNYRTTNLNLHLDSLPALEAWSLSFQSPSLRMSIAERQVCSYTWNALRTRRPGTGAESQKLGLLVPNAGGSGGTQGDSRIRRKRAKALYVSLANPFI